VFQDESAGVVPLCHPVATDHGMANILLTYHTHTIISVFICTGQTPWLNGKHVVFGKVTSGMDVLKRMEVKGTDTGRPLATVTIKDCGAL
jgi:cyclophilin family peptidyl-prolyl cis-trans isomerase